MLAGCVLREACRPLGCGEFRRDIIRRKDRDGATGFLVGPVHLQDEVALEVPVLKKDGVPGVFQHPSDPGRPGAISLVAADEEIALAIRIVSHSGFGLLDWLSRLSLHPTRSSTGP